MLLCSFVRVDVRLCCAASSMNDRRTSSMSSCVPRSGVTMLSSSVPQTSSATCPQITLELTLKYSQNSHMRIPTDSTSYERHTIPELLLGRQHSRSLLGFCAHSLVAVPGELIHRPIQSGCCSRACLRLMVTAVLLSKWRIVRAQVHGRK
jgi:hypothetical protein